VTEQIKTTVTLAALLAEYEQDHQDKRPDTTWANGDVRLTASALHTWCRRQTALAAVGTQPTHPERQGQPGPHTVGTMLHEAYAAYWRRQPRTIVETPTPLGTPDVLRVDDYGDVVEVRDLKTINTRAMTMWKKQGGPPSKTWDQLAIYAYASGANPDTVLVIDALCRDSGEAQTYTCEYDVQWGQDVAQSLQDLAADMTARPGMQQPGRGALDDYACQRCPYFGYCKDAADQARQGLTVIDGGRA